MSTQTMTRVPVLADLIPGARARDIALTLAGTALITVAGYVAIPLPFTPVPLSLATFAVLLTGATLGPLRGAASAGLYLALGMIGVRCSLTEHPVGRSHHSATSSATSPRRSSSGHSPAAAPTARCR